jgi:hypothetical protein
VWSKHLSPIVYSKAILARAEITVHRELFDGCIFRSFFAIARQPRMYHA